VHVPPALRKPLPGAAASASPAAAANGEAAGGGGGGSGAVASPPSPAAVDAVLGPALGHRLLSIPSDFFIYEVRSRTHRHTPGQRPKAAYPPLAHPSPAPQYLYKNHTRHFHPEPDGRVTGAACGGKGWRPPHARQEPLAGLRLATQSSASLPPKDRAACARPLRPARTEDWLLGTFSRESLSLISSATGEVAGLEVRAAWGAKGAGREGAARQPPAPAVLRPAARRTRAASSVRPARRSGAGPSARRTSHGAAAAVHVAVREAGVRRR
jgi:hypothetical protein